MIVKDEDMEAYGAMVYRGKVEQATNTRNYHGDQKRALDEAIAGLEGVSTLYEWDLPDCVDHVTANLMYKRSQEALQKVKEILG